MFAQQTSSATQPAGRVQRLRQRIIDAPREVCVERARYLTQSMAAHWKEHPVTRMSLALEHILGNISIIIREDELLVGCRTSKLNGAPFFPENKSRWIESDLESFNDRVLQKILITEEEQAELREKILPFWNGKAVECALEERMPPDVAQDMDKYIFTMILEITYGIGHFTMNHPRILGTGLSGVIQEARRKLDELPGGCETKDKALFYEAVIRSCQAAIRFANRYAELAESMAEKETNSERAAELRAIAAVCRRVPEYPARTFHEAIQCVYFIHLIAQLESGGNSISLGRIDQILWPYFEADQKAGRIRPDAARELLSLLFIKTNEIWNILEEAFIPGGEGVEGKTTQNVTVGGVGPEGKDATNELSYLGLDAYADVRTVQPNFGVRLAPNPPQDFLLKAVGYAKDGVLMHLFNDEAIIRSLTAAGHTLEDARNYGVVGCLEPNAQGKTFGSTFAIQFSGIKCLEFALSGGMDNIFGYNAGLATQDPLTFSSFDEVWQAYTNQVSHFMKQMVRGMEVMDQTLAEMVPSPFASAMIDGPLQKGLDLTQGGAIYNSTGVQLVGFANVANSLYAIKKAVFEDQTVSMEELVGYLADDWENAEDKRIYFQNKLPKYGNDHDEVDAMAKRVLENFCDEVLKHKNQRGGYFWPGVFSVGFHIAMGAFAGASPDGRHGGEVLGNGITPMTGSTKQGPTAVINSVVKLPLWKSCNGVNLNLRFHPHRLRPEILVSLIKSYFQKGGVQVQFNMVDSEMLKEAQRNPDQYRDLVVRVSGYSALFAGLSDVAQNEIISRTEYEI